MKKGFTLIELIFVIVIIGILAAIAIPKLNATRADAQGAAFAQETQQIIDEIISHVLANGGALNSEPLTIRSQTLKQVIEENKGAANTPGTWAAIRVKQNTENCVAFWEYNETTLRVYGINGNSVPYECKVAKKILKLPEWPSTVDYKVVGSKIKF